MNRITELFGIKHYNLDRVELIWREVNQLSDEWMVRTVDLFIGNKLYPPLMPDFREEISKERERLWNMQKREEKKTACGISNYLCSECTGSGLIWDEAGCVFRCHCESGSKRIEKYPRLMRPNLKAVK